MCYLASFGNLFQFIETQVLWEGELTRKFGVWVYG